MYIFQHPTSRAVVLGFALWLSGAVSWAPPYRADDRSAAEAVSPYDSDQHLQYFASHGLALTHREVVALLSNSLGESYLVRFARHQPSENESRRLTGTPDGLQVAGSRALLWTFSQASGGVRLHDLDTGRQTEIFHGPVLPLVWPALVDDRIWWTTKVNGVVRVAFQDAPWTDPSTIRYSTPVPKTAAETRFAFSSRQAVLLDEKENGALLWKGSGNWHSLKNPKGYEIVGVFGDTVLAADAGQTRLRRLDLPLGSSSEWEVPLYQADPGFRIDLQSFQRSPLADAVVFVEATVEGESRLVKLPLSGRLRAPIRQPLVPDFRDERSTLHWTWDGSWFAAVRHEQSQLWLVSGPSGRLAESLAAGPAREALEPRRATLVAPPPEPLPEPSMVRSPRRGDPKALALDWLESQLAAAFKRADGKTAVLIDSYEDDVRAGWIYDAALAAIAFTAAGKTATARRLLRGLEALQEEEGSWIFSYDPDRVRPLGSDRYVGSMAWVIMAANFYEWETRDRGFAEMARRGLASLERFRQNNPQQENFGAISMGPANPQGFSTEHNLDCYSAFLWRGKLDRNPHYRGVAEGIRRFLLGVQWAQTPTSGEGYFKVGYRDNELFLDAQSWSVLALWDGDPGASSRLQEALATAERRLLTTSGRLGGVSGIVGFKETANVVTGDKVWAEGTEGVVAALHVLGKRQEAAHYHSQTERYQTASGGIPYATENSDAWSTAPAVAGTAWFLLNSLSPPRNPFHPDG